MLVSTQDTRARAKRRFLRNNPALRIAKYDGDRTFRCDLVPGIDFGKSYIRSMLLTQFLPGPVVIGSFTFLPPGTPFASRVEPESRSKAPRVVSG